MIYLGIDPGPHASALARLNEAGSPLVEKLPNAEAVAWLASRNPNLNDGALLIEKPVGFGTIGADVIMTAFWAGRFAEAWGGAYDLIPRGKVLAHLGVVNKGTDAQVKAALLDRYGGQQRAIGSVRCPRCAGSKQCRSRVSCAACGGSCFVQGKRGPKKCPGCSGRGNVLAYVRCDTCDGGGWEYPPGPLAGVAGADCWDALAVAVVAFDTCAPAGRGRREG